MSPEPEIIRRCSICGTAYRAGAAFCPQCGNSVSVKSPTNPVAELGSRLAETMADSPAPRLSETAPVIRQPQPTTPAARDVSAARTPPKIEKREHVSSALLREAKYDPSVRFILVAIVLFLLSVLLLLMSKFMR